MKLSRVSFLILIFALVTGCGGSGGSGSSSSVGGGTPPAATANNVLSITVNGPGLNNSYLNEPCVSVTICTPGTTNCQTINGILLDTGSSGLRIFRQALSVPLTQIASGSGSLADLVLYADGSCDWGPVQMASVILGNEPAVEVPIQVIDHTFGTISGQCVFPDQSPTDTGYNGILGVGLFVHDCGSDCINSIPPIPIYYSCSGSNCPGTTVALDSQVQNPVALLPQDNNGVIVQLPGIPAGGSPSVKGSLVLGIGTQSNNVPSGVTAYGADPQIGDFTTNFNGTSFTSFIDSGSNGLFFPSTSALPDCPGSPPISDWFCPSSTVSLSATNTGASGSPSGAVSFQIGNFDSLVINSSNNVFDDIGGNFPDGFDWGLPFFFGRSVFVGIEGKGSSLGFGPYWAY